MVSSDENIFLISNRNCFSMPPKILTVIAPIKITSSRKDIHQKIDWMFDSSNFPEQISFLIVDDGSSCADYELLKSKENNCCKVIQTDSTDSDFNLARVRNFGVMHSRSNFVMFMDADLLPYPGFFESILNEIELLNLQEDVYKFLMVPVIYLTELGYLKLKDLRPELWQQYFINQVLSHDDAVIEKYSSGTSAIVVERDYYLSRGGQDERFEGWGYEDYEFTNRLILRDNTFPRPLNYISMKGNFQTTKRYEGWKAVYRLYGDWLLAKGIYLLHVPHAIDLCFQAAKEKNLKLLLESIEKNLNNSNDAEPVPLYQHGAGSSLLFRKNPFCYDRSFSPFLGKIFYENESKFSSVEAFSDYLLKNEIVRVVFPNPYANEKLLDFYNYCRRTSLSYVVCERGALPDSIYHDSKGFLTDSTSYDSHKWDVELSSSQREQVLNYIESIRTGEEVVEKQVGRADISRLKESLGIHKDQKLVFVPFQQPNDTVVKYFSGQLRGYDGFRNEIIKLVNGLGSEWTVIYKKHPVEEEIEPIKGAVQVNDYHVYDLLEISDAVVVLNSGVGVFALMFQKPLYVLGEAWYAHEGLCVKISSGLDLAQSIQKGFDLDYERMLRFIYYLRFKFYSFGRMTQRRVHTEEGHLITATTSIDYYELRGWSDSVRMVSCINQDKILISEGPLFDRYHEIVSIESFKQSKKNEDALKKSLSFKLYAFVYSLFLSDEKSLQLKSSPQDFFQKAKHPFSKAGKLLFRNYL